MKNNYLRIATIHLVLTTLLTSGNFYASGQIVEWDDCEKFLGNISQGSTPSNWLDYWNQVTPENAGKWGSVEGSRDNMNWNNLDIAYDLAKDNGYLFKQHVFVWGNQQPGWIETLPEEEQLEEIEEWIMLFCERYPDTDIIEVVNEPLNDPPFGTGNGNYAPALGGTGETGRDWIIKAFELAREHCPNAELMINEYNILNGSSLINSYIGIVNLLKSRDLIDAVGVQAHEFTVFNRTAEELTESLDQLAQTELPIYVTELDIGSGDNSQPIDDQLQLEKYEEIFPALWRHPSVKGITLWGYRQSNIWRTTAYLVNSDGSERPALEWMKNFVTAGNSQCDGVTSVDGNTFEESIFQVFPNPLSNGQLQIKSNQQVQKIEVRNMGGKIIDTIYPNYTSNNISVNLDLKKGIYLVKVSGIELSEMHRIIIN